MVCNNRDTRASRSEEERRVPIDRHAATRGGEKTRGDERVFSIFQIKPYYGGGGPRAQKPRKNEYNGQRDYEQRSVPFLTVSVTKRPPAEQLCAATISPLRD